MKKICQKYKRIIVSGLGIGVILQWLTLFFSYQELPNAYEDIHEPIATGGFPFKAFEYPVPPMGSDWPPVEMWPMFFANLGIWIIVGFIITFLLRKKGEQEETVKRIIVTALFLSLIGLFYLMLKFD